MIESFFIFTDFIMILSVVYVGVTAVMDLAAIKHSFIFLVNATLLVFSILLTLIAETAMEISCNSFVGQLHNFIEVAGGDIGLIQSFVAALYG